MEEMKHEDKMHMGHHHHKPWQSNWKSPVALGIFLLTGALALAIVLYMLLNIVGVIEAAAHPSPADGGMTQQQLQQLMQQAPASSGATSGAGQ